MMSSKQRAFFERNADAAGRGRVAIRHLIWGVENDRKRTDVNEPAEVRDALNQRLDVLRVAFDELTKMLSEAERRLDR